MDDTKNTLQAFIKTLMPEATEEERHIAENNYRRYLDLVKQIHTRIKMEKAASEGDKPP